MKLDQLTDEACAIATGLTNNPGLRKAAVKEITALAQAWALDAVNAAAAEVRLTLAAQSGREASRLADLTGIPRDDFTGDDPGAAQP